LIDGHAHDYANPHMPGFLVSDRYLSIGFTLLVFYGFIALATATPPLREK
jgi:hypothetical protein